jgi:HK97 family phage major capsid protein
MSKIEKMRAKREDLRLQAVGVITRAEAEERVLTDDERAKVTQFESDIAKWDASIEAARGVLAIAKQRAEETDGDNADDEPAPEIPKPTPKPDGVRAIPRPNPQDNGKQFRSFGEQLTAVYKSSLPGARVDERLTTRAASGLSETNPSDGGFLVQQDFVAELIKKTFETGILAGKVKKLPVSTNANGIKINAAEDDDRRNGARLGGVAAYWENEADQLIGSKPKWRQMDLNLKKLTGLCYATDELLADAAALESIIRQAFIDEFSFKVDDAILSGGGTGQPLGILKSGALVKQELEPGQTAKITVENIVKMWSRLWPRSAGNAVWFVNQELQPLLYALKVGDRPVYIPAGGLAETPYATILGRPVVPLEQCSALGEVGDIILADLSQYLLIDKGGIDAASSVHVRLLFDECVFRFVYRVDGQPIWSKPIQPYKGNNTLSPFITLAKRN